MEHDYLKETSILNYSESKIQSLIEKRGWKNLGEYEKVKAIYDFVKDEIKFGYNISDDIKASEVLTDGYGQCNTKGTLFMALLRGCGIPCRIHAFNIDKLLQKGAMTGFVYKKAPQKIFHSWVEVLCEDEWYNLEGFILDKDYLDGLKRKFPSVGREEFFGYGVAVKDFSDLQVYFNGNDTYIQSAGIVDDFGVYDSPDDMYKEHGQNMKGLKKAAYAVFGRKLMNGNVNKIRSEKAGNK